MAKKLYYKIGEACRELDIQPYVLRYWETEFPNLSPTKSKSGQRVYNEADLAMIQRIKELLYDEGYTIAGAKKKLEGEEPPSRRAAKPKAPPKPKVKAEKPEAKAAAATQPAPAPKAAKKTPAKAASKAPQRKRAAAATNADAQRVAQLERAIRKALTQTEKLLALLDKSV